MLLFLPFADLEDRRVQYNDFLNECHPNVGTFLHEAVKVSSFFRLHLRREIE